MNLSVIQGPRRRTAAFVILFALFAAFPVPSPAAEVRDRFSGYPEDVRTQIQRVVSAASPGAMDTLRKEVRLLGRKMHGRGILSINALPDAIFERAVKEGWKKDAESAIRTVTEAAPFSVPMWAWLVARDVGSFRIAETLHDARALAGAMRHFAPALMGYAAWLIAFLSATGLWFAVWVGLSMFLRARPAIQADVVRFLPIPFKEFVSAFIVLLVFLLPIAAGCGIVVTVSVWLVVSTGYLRRGEVAVTTATIVFLGLIFLGGGVLTSMEMMQGQTREGGWLGGEGAFTRVWPGGKEEERLFSTEISRMIRFARARAAMQSGNPAASETIWTDLLRESPAPPAEILNNRGVSFAQQGKLKEALADFEAAVARDPKEPAPLWNAYQTYLALFNIEQARKIQPQVWERMEQTTPYGFRPAEMEQGEWLASPLPVEDAWEIFVGFRGDWIRVVERSDFFRAFFHPLSARFALVFLGGVALFAALWKIVSLKIWVHRTCRACGVQNLIVGAREASDLCTACRSKIGDTLRGGDERERRVLKTVIHRRYVTLCSILVPGAGAFWAGRDITVLAYGLLLSVCLGGISASLGNYEAGFTLLVDLQGWVTRGALAASAVVWAAGSVWSLKAFRRLQWEQGIATFTR